MRTVFFFILFVISTSVLAQSNYEWVDEIEVDKIEPNTKKTFWLKMIDNGMSQPICIPVIVLKGKQQSPILGLTAAIHGNELNGIQVIHQLIDEIDLSTLNGTLIAIPGLNGISIPQHRRRYVDEEDLNRNFPGKKNGNRSQQYVWQINNKILSKIEYLVDMHTASFGRENSLYVRAKLDDDTTAQMAKIQDADIVLNSNGLPSTADLIPATRTMRAEAMLNGIPCITVEYGNPQVFQPEIVERGITGIKNIMSWLKMIDLDVEKTSKPVFCKKSYWIYTDEGGYLDVTVGLKQHLKKGDLIAILRNPFGAIIKKYYCPEDGIVIGKSSNPINMNGGRIIHLGIIGE